MGKLIIERGYGVTPNHILNDKTLSFKAKGLFGYMQSKPDNWHFNAKRISDETADGKDAILSGLKELEDAGLLVRERRKDNKGRWEWVHVLREKPLLDNPETDNPSLDKPANNKTIDTKQYIENNNSNNTTYTDNNNIIKYINNNNNCDEGKTVESKDIVSVLDAFKEFNPAVGRLYANKTQRKACEDLIKTYGLENVLKAISVLPQINSQKYTKKSYTPLDLWNNWVSYKHKAIENKPNITVI